MIQALDFPPVFNVCVEARNNGESAEWRLTSGPPWEVSGPLDE